MKRFKLRNLDVDRVDLVKRGANQHADIVIYKGLEEDEARARIAKNLREGYPGDTQLKNGPPPVPRNVRRKKKKKDKGAKGSAFPERNAAESSTSAGSAPVEKHARHNQKDHDPTKGKGATRGDGKPRTFDGSRMDGPGANGYQFNSTGPDGTRYEWKVERGKLYRKRMSQANLQWKVIGNNVNSTSRANDFLVGGRGKHTDVKRGMDARKEIEAFKDRKAKAISAPSLSSKDVSKARIATGLAKHTPGGKGHDQDKHGDRAGAGKGKKKFEPTAEERALARRKDSPGDGIPGTAGYKSRKRMEEAAKQSRKKADAKGKKVPVTVGDLDMADRIADTPGPDPSANAKTSKKSTFFEVDMGMLNERIGTRRVIKLIADADIVGETIRREVFSDKGWQMLIDDDVIGMKVTKAHPKPPFPTKAAGKPTDTRQAVPTGSPVPGKPVDPATAPGRVSDGGPPLGPGSAGGRRPVETPKKKTVGSAAKPAGPPELDPKKKAIATDLKRRKGPPSGIPSSR